MLYVEMIGGVVVLFDVKQIHNNSKTYNIIFHNNDMKKGN